MKRQVSLSIGRCSDGTIRLMVEDTASSTAVMELVLTSTQFGNAVTGLTVECEATFRGLDRIGTRHEYKAQEVCLPTKFVPGDVAQACYVWEREGWYPRLKDVENLHNYIRSDGGLVFYRIGFDRWVPDKEASDAN